MGESRLELTLHCPEQVSPCDRMISSYLIANALVAFLGGFMASQGRIAPEWNTCIRWVCEDPLPSEIQAGPFCIMSYTVTE
jgi:hypothetical protein